MNAESRNDPVGFFTETSWTAGIIGLGYIGLPLLLTASRSGLGAIGFDVDESIVDQLKLGASHIDDVADDDLINASAGGATFTQEPSRLAEADAIFICVPSPLGRNRQPDLSYIESASRTIEEVARPGQLVVLESTSYPGTTEEYIVPSGGGESRAEARRRRLRRICLGKALPWRCSGNRADPEGRWRGN